MMPRSRIEPASSPSSASEKWRRGLRGLGLRNSIGTRRWPRACCCCCTVTLSLPTSPISAARPRPSRARGVSSAIDISPEPRLPALKLALPHGEERRAATRLEPPTFYATSSRGVARQRGVSKDGPLRGRPLPSSRTRVASAPQDEGGVGTTARCGSARAQLLELLLALDDLGGEPQIGFAADALEIVDQHRLA